MQQDSEIFWDRQRETLPADQRQALIFDRIKYQLNYVYERIPFYRQLYDAHGVHPEAIKDLNDFTTKVPIATKAMLQQSQRDHPPFGNYLGVDFSQVKRIQATSGTTGQPTLFAISGEDWEHVSEAQAMQCWAAGLRPSDIVQIAFPLSLYVGGWGLLGAAERIGAKVLPMAGGNTERQIAMLQQVGASVICGTPSFCLHILETARDMGIELVSSRLRLGFFGGEPGASIPSVKQRLESGFGIRAIDFGNVAELHPCSNMECSHGSGMHVYQDVDYTEVVNPQNPNQSYGYNRRGAVVYTHLWRKSQPMIRYFPGDETLMTDEPCACGRTYPRMPHGIIGRLDDMIIVRGVKFYPGDVEALLRGLDGMGTEFRIILERQGELDQVRIEAECDTTIDSDLFRTKAEQKLQSGLGMRVTVMPKEQGYFPLTQFKARRVIDRRPRHEQ
ncbi:MAG: AMP-binding protein [Candidatus Thiodiazotropha endolucinida]|uniref:AMP-binding protein n=1 Tax=Candidatus Thiodiazotropha taylori TaxID=2792791 RepID=A0A9E4NMW4_9GAMM|nr:AMP-binding protein [Candidatus Thiodiazotropha taylori]MCW4237741.1 AMP-binding protein [Candidatus Thiodiazotropha endolucinida]